ncbi:MAG: diacylglycerol kinase [Elusimicrobia bacterium]|nr:diacylglycerol kinase [Elusimicrobiota bacterium]
MRSEDIWESFNAAIEGIIYVTKTQRSMRVHLGIAVFVLFFSLFVRLDRLEVIMLTITIVLVLLAEMFNTAVETLVNLITDTYHPAAKVAKDIAAGAVFFASGNALIVAYLVFGKRYLGNNLAPLISKIKEVPEYIMFISLIIVFIFVIIGKAYFGKGRPLWGGMPSGHSAVAFSICTAIVLTTENSFITLMVFLLAFMVAHSRIRARIHTWWEVAGGAILGMIVTLFIFRMMNPF